MPAARSAAAVDALRPESPPTTVPFAHGFERRTPGRFGRAAWAVMWRRSRSLATEIRGRVLDAGDTATRVAPSSTASSRLGLQVLPCAVAGCRPRRRSGWRGPDFRTQPRGEIVEVFEGVRLAALDLADRGSRGAIPGGSPDPKQVCPVCRRVPCHTRSSPDPISSSLAASVDCAWKQCGDDRPGRERHRRRMLGGERESS